MLAEDRFDSLLCREFTRANNAAAHPDQLAFPGYEHLLKRWHVERRTVGQYLQLIERRQKRTQMNQIADQDALRLADLVRDQPLDLSMPEAIARATGGEAVAKKKATK